MKKSYILFFTLLLLSIGSLDSSAQGKVDFFPVSSAYKKEITTYKYAFVSQGATLAAASLQGLVNRDTARILLEDNLTQHIAELYLAEGLITSVNKYTNIFFLLRDFKDYYTGAVVYDPANKFTINLATNIAGVENRVIISPDMVDNFKGYTGNYDVTDLREHGFTSRYQAWIWYEQNILPFQRKDVLAVANDHYMHDVYRDYLIEFKIPTFWLPGPSDPDYDINYENRIKNLFASTPANIPVLGFWPDANGEGYEEYGGVKLAGEYGKFTVVNTWVGNYSFHSALQLKPYYHQGAVRTKDFRDYDASKKYVALIMIESGDSPGYMQFGFSQRQWDDPYRGQVAINYGINPSMRMLLPAYLDYLYRTATGNDFFFNSISGAGYCYPFEGYGRLTNDAAHSLREYFSVTAENMQILDLEMLGLYTHPNTTHGKWTSQDLQLFKDFIEPMPGLNSVISGMHRTGYTAANGNAWYNDYEKDVTVHHTLTFWPSTDYTWNDPDQDDAAVAFLENEIKTYGTGGDFIQAMFYSWMYGPRRLTKLQEKLSAEGYEFVTLNEFDHLYRISQGIDTTGRRNTWIIRETDGEDVDFTSISDAINSPSVTNGDRLDILGTFTESGIQLTKELSFLGHGKNKSIIQAAQTTAEATDRVFYYNQFPGIDRLEFRDLTISNGNAVGNGGALYLLGQVDLILHNVAIRDNKTSANGGGLYFWGRSLDMIYTDFTANIAMGRYAGLDLWLQQGYPVNVNISNSLFSENEALGHGGAVGITKVWTTNADCNITIKNTSFYKNKAESGPVFWMEATKETPQGSFPEGDFNLKLTNNTFLGNESTGIDWQGIITIWTPSVSSLMAYNNLFKNNTNTNSSSTSTNYDLWLADNLASCELYNNLGTSLPNIPAAYSTTSANNKLTASVSELVMDDQPENNGGKIKTIALHEGNAAIKYVPDHRLDTDARGEIRKRPRSDCGAYETAAVVTVSVKPIKYTGQVNVYPNPTEGKIYFSEPVKAELSVYDIRGQLLKKQKAHGQQSINISDLSPGMYILSFSSGESFMQSVKIFKK